MLLLGCWLLPAPAPAGAATATVQGHVKIPNGLPVGDALVVIQIEGQHGYLPQDTIFTETDSHGEYLVHLTTPVDQFYQLTVFVARRHPPFYKPGFGATTGPVAEGATVTFDFTLSPLSTGAVVEGYLTDHQFGDPIPTVGIFTTEGYNTGPIIRTYSNGYYLLTLNLPGTEPVDVHLTTGGGVSGLRYPGQSKTLRLRSGATKRVDFSISQDVGNAAYVFGRVISGSTGQPIPYATIVFDCEHLSPDCPPVAITFQTTDQFGRFVQDVNLPWLTPTGRVVLSTNGTYEFQGGPYQPATMTVPKPLLGTSQEVDFDLTPQVKGTLRH